MVAVMATVYTRQPTSGEPIMPAVPLTLLEREEIRAGIEQHETISEIGRRLDRLRCTIGAQVSHTGGRGAYWALVAQARVDR